MDFPGVKRNGKFVMPPAIEEQSRRYWERVKDGTPVIKSMTVPRNDKTQSQLGAIFGLMLVEACTQFTDWGHDTSLIYNINKPTGIEITPLVLKGYLYNVCPMYNEQGQRITLSKSNTAEAAKFFDDCRNWLASQWSVVTSEPDPNWREKP